MSHARPWTRQSHSPPSQSDHFRTTCSLFPFSVEVLQSLFGFKTVEIIMYFVLKKYSDSGLDSDIKTL